MEIKIVITDAGPAAGAPSAVSVEGAAAGAAGAGGAAASPPAGAPAAGLPSLQDRAGAIDAGPAPPAAAAFSPSGEPPPFVAQRAANVFGPGGVGASTDESGGAAPGSGTGLETSIREAGNV